MWSTIKDVNNAGLDTHVNLHKRTKALNIGDEITQKTFKI